MKKIILMCCFNLLIWGCEDKSNESANIGWTIALEEELIDGWSQESYLFLGENPDLTFDELRVFIECAVKEAKTRYSYNEFLIIMIESGNELDMILDLCEYLFPYLSLKI